MARTRTNFDNLAPEQVARANIEYVANNAPRPEKVAWERKLSNMTKLIDQLRPFEEQIIELIAQKQEIMDQISTLRAEMVQSCVHPQQYLNYNEDSTVSCKFCNRRLVRVAPQSE